MILLKLIKQAIIEFTQSTYLHMPLSITGLPPEYPLLELHIFSTLVKKLPP